MKNQKIKIHVVIMIFIVSVAYSNEHWDLKQLSTANPNAKAWLVQIQGDSVLVGKKASKKVLQKNHLPYLIDEGDILVTGMDDRATILLRDGSVVWVNYMTIFKVSDLNVPSVVPGQSIERYKVSLQLKVGVVRVRVPKVRTVQKSFTVRTPMGSASVRGTEEVVQYSPDLGTKVQVLSGLVSVENQDKGLEYASRGEKVALKSDTKDNQTVNEKRRSQVKQSLPIVSDSEESKTILLPDIETIAFIPAEGTITGTVTFNPYDPSKIITPPGATAPTAAQRTLLLPLTHSTTTWYAFNIYPQLTNLINRALGDQSVANQVVPILNSDPKLGGSGTDPTLWLGADIRDALSHLF